MWKNDNYADIPSPPPLNPPPLPRNKSNWTDISGVARGKGASWPCISKTYFLINCDFFAEKNCRGGWWWGGSEGFKLSEMGYGFRLCLSNLEIHRSLHLLSFFPPVMDGISV